MFVSHWLIYWEAVQAADVILSKNDQTCTESIDNISKTVRDRAWCQSVFQNLAMLTNRNPSTTIKKNFQTAGRVNGPWQGPSLFFLISRALERAIWGRTSWTLIRIASAENTPVIPVAIYPQILGFCLGTLDFMIWGALQNSPQIMKSRVPKQNPRIWG